MCEHAGALLFASLIYDLEYTDAVTIITAPWEIHASEYLFLGFFFDLLPTVSLGIFP